MDILVPIDGSDTSFKALEEAYKQYPDAAVTALYVSDPVKGQNRMMAGGRFGEWMETEKRRASEIFETARTYAEGTEASIETVHEFGAPIRLIPEYATDREFDLVVIGNRGQGPLAKLTLGSVSDRVIRQVPMPVLVVKNDS